jgi:hypothetical protein
MMDEKAVLPDQFFELEPFAKIWGHVEDSAERFLLRQRCTKQEIKLFYETMAPRLEEVFLHLDTYGPEEAMPPPEKALYLTSLGLAEISFEVELFHGPLPFLPKDYVMHIDWIDYDVGAASVFNTFSDP